MKNRYFLAIAFTLIALTGSAQSNHPNTIREKLNAFVEAKEYNVQKLSDSKDLPCLASSSSIRPMPSNR